MGINDQLLLDWHGIGLNHLPELRHSFKFRGCFALLYNLEVLIPNADRVLAQYRLYHRGVLLERLLEVVYDRKPNCLIPMYDEPAHFDVLTCSPKDHELNISFSETSNSIFINKETFPILLAYSK